MEKQTYTIDQLTGEAWNIAISVLAGELKDVFGIDVKAFRDNVLVATFASRTQVRFYEDGHIAR